MHFLVIYFMLLTSLQGGLIQMAYLNND